MRVWSALVGLGGRAAAGERALDSRVRGNEGLRCIAIFFAMSLEQVALAQAAGTPPLPPQAEVRPPLEAAGAPPLPQQPEAQPPLEQAAEVVIAERAAAEVAKLEVPSLLVLPFAYADGVPSAEGALLGERVATALSQMEGLRLVDRTQLEKILEEQRLSASGLVNPASAVRVGQLMGAAAILTGSISDLGENIEVHTRVVSTETGEVLRQDSLGTRKTLKTFISPLWTRIEEIQQKGESFKVELWAEASNGVTGIPSRRIGEELVLHFRAEKDCYITLFDFTTSGSIHVLFPNAFMKDNKVKAGRTYTLPTAEAGLKIRVQGPPGVERLKLFATTSDTPLFQYDYSTESFRSLDDDAPNPTRDLEIVLEQTAPAAWAETHMELLIEQTLRAPGQP